MMVLRRKHLKKHLIVAHGAAGRKTAADLPDLEDDGSKPNDSEIDEPDFAPRPPIAASSSSSSSSSS